MNWKQGIRGVAAVAVVSLLTAAVGPAVGAQQPPAATQVRDIPLREGVVAVVNDEVISTFDLRQRMTWIIMTTGIQPNEQNIPEIQAEATDSLIDERLQSQELIHRAVERRLERTAFLLTDEEVTEEIQQLAGRNGMTVQQFYALLETRGLSVKSFREQIRVSRSWTQWISGFYGSRVRIGDDQVQAVLDRITASASKPSYLISEIFIEASRTGSIANATSSANARITQLQQGARFEALAQQFSGLPTAANGGDAGWLSSGELVPEVEAALERMNPGQISRPIVVADGVYVIMLREKRAGGVTTLVNLKQAAISLPADAPPNVVQAAQNRLLAIKRETTNCTTLQGVAAAANVTVDDLGETEPKDLAPAFREIAETLAVGQVAEPIRTANGLHLVAVCAKRSVGADIPSKEEIRGRLRGEQLTMLERRELRNLRSAATISRPR